MHERCSSRSPMLERSLREIQSGKYMFALREDVDPRNPGGAEAGKIVTVSGSEVRCRYSLNIIDDFEIDLAQVVQGNDPFSFLDRSIERLINCYGYKVDGKTAEGVLDLVKASRLSTVSAAFRYSGDDGRAKTVVVFPHLLTLSKGLEEAILISAAFTQITEAKGIKPFKDAMKQARY